MKRVFAEESAYRIDYVVLHEEHEYRERENEHQRDLAEVCQEYYPEYYNVIDNRDTLLTGYNKIFKSLHSYRNQISHGDGKPVEMISIHMSSSILAFIALYVRTVVKYY